MGGPLGPGLKSKKIMKRGLYYLLLFSSLMCVPLFWFAALNTAVSLEYEVAEPGDCISLVTGWDLCLVKKVFMVLAYTSVIIFLLLAALYNKLVRRG